MAKQVQETAEPATIVQKALSPEGLLFDQSGSQVRTI